MEKVRPVKRFAAILHADAESLKDCLKALEAAFGSVDYESAPLPFDVTGYYAAEMGPTLFRTLISFREPAHPEMLARDKRAAIAIEDSLKTAGGNRRVNIDSGYLDPDKVVLASTKKGPYKIYMADGIWADLTLHYEKGRFLPFPWSFADFKDGRYEKALLSIRERYKKAKA